MFYFGHQAGQGAQAALTGHAVQMGQGPGEVVAGPLLQDGERRGQDQIAGRGLVVVPAIQQAQHQAQAPGRRHGQGQGFKCGHVSPIQDR